MRSPRRFLNRIFSRSVPRAADQAKGHAAASPDADEAAPASTPTPTRHVSAGDGSHAVSSDVPIREPSQDAYGIDAFAKAIARSIAAADASEGLVLAVNGAWGSGKSSACNLILHHLRDGIKAGQIIPVTFNPWWFSGAEALTVSFFQELSVSIGKSLPEQARETLAALGTRISSAGPLLGGIAALWGSPAASAALAGGAQWVGKVTRMDTTVEEEHRKLSGALRAQRKKFLVVIDDIDRLGTDDALLIFRLVKSVGRLPNVIYLLAFDRRLAENMVSERFPAEGPSYLEKVIQGGFDLPPPDVHDLRDAVLRTVGEVMGVPPEPKMIRFWNLFYEIPAPLIRTPRDAVRLSNAVRVSWPAVSDEVDRADFLALEALRLFLPAVHAAIRSNPDMLCGASPSGHGARDRPGQLYEDTFLGDLKGRDRHIARQALLRLFPRMESIWSNTWRTDTEGWQRDRLACSERHFPTYFAFSVHEEAITAAELNLMLTSAQDAAATAALLRKSVEQPRRRGGTRAALALEELMVHAPDIRDNDIPPFLTGLFSVADELDVSADEARGFRIRSNNLRIHWLINKLVRDRIEQQKRTELIESACKTASLAWLESIANRCSDDHKADKEKQGLSDEPLVTAAAAARLAELCLARYREAAADGTLARHRQMIWLLFRWRDRVGPEEVRRWTDNSLAVDEFVIALAEQSVHTYSTQNLSLSGVGDVVSAQIDYVNLKSLAPLVDVDRFRQRVEELLALVDLPPADRARLERFKATPEKDPEHDR